MSETPFYNTRMGHRFYESTMPALVKQLERLADGLRAESGTELATAAEGLVEAAELVLNTPIEPGSPQTRDAFDMLKANMAAVRRKIG